MNDRAEADRARATILVVEDDAAMRDLLVEELSEAGFISFGSLPGNGGLVR